MKPPTAKQLVTSVVFVLSMISRSLSAAEDPHAADRQQLRQLMAEVEGAINDQNIDRMLTQFDDNATVTWLNAEVSRGKADIKAYYQRMVGGEQAILKKYLTKA